MTPYYARATAAVGVDLAGSLRARSTILTLK
jgi:hypothetical protein